MKKNWKKYSFEFLSIFIAVISAFALNNWNDNRRDRLAEFKILSEISVGLNKDLEDIENNMYGHEIGIKSVDFFKQLLIPKDTVPNDSILRNYFILTRDFFSVQNTSGYENLKSRGLELIQNDSLRTKIISLYEIDYTILRKFEEEYYEKQFQQNYFKELNHMIAPNFEFDNNKSLKRIKIPLEMSNEEEKIFLIILWKIKINRNEIMQHYELTKEKVVKLKKEIENELKR